MGPYCNCSNPKSPFSYKNMRKVPKSQKTHPLNVAILHLLVCFMTHIDVFSGQKRIFQILHFSPIVFPIKTLKMVARPQFLSKYSNFFCKHSGIGHYILWQTDGSLQRMLVYLGCPSLHPIAIVTLKESTTEPR